LNLALCVATMRPKVDGLWPGDIPLAVSNATTDPKVYVEYNTPEHNLGVTGSYDKLYRESSEEILAFLHDDVVLREKAWDQRVLKEFEDPQVGLLGFGGALWHGVPDLYKIPYALHDLRRGDYRSNVDDAEVHGERFEGACDVAVLDGFALVCRRVFLARIHGFESFPVEANYFCYDYILAGLARRHHWRIRLVGIRGHHRGGSASINGKSPFTSQEYYDKSHRWFYDNFRDVLPAKVK
jgi:Glycosyltransferase like family